MLMAKGKNEGLRNTILQQFKSPLDFLGNFKKIYSGVDCKYYTLRVVMFLVVTPEALNYLATHRTAFPLYLK